MPKKLPIGIQSISEIINGGYVYIDKTQFALSLLQEGKFYFMARPRRFGKTLFVSTLEAILCGNKKLFDECYICNSNYDWTKYPVLHFDFTLINSKSSGNLEIGLQETLESFASDYKVALKGASLESRFVNLIKSLSSKYNQVAILVDEYDKPLLDNLKKLQVARANREVLRTFFGTLKGVDNHLKFVFVTGVGKFALTSLFSGLNNLKDITIREEFATLFGYTEDEIKQYLFEHIQKVTKKTQVRNPKTCEQDILNSMKEWYNGYKFYHEGPAVYNPHSTLSFLDEGMVKNFWFRTGTPSFLFHQVRKIPLSIADLGRVKEKEDTLMNIHKLDKMNLKSLMWQTGYLSIQDYDENTRSYTLDFPNREVRTSFFESLLEEFAEQPLLDEISRSDTCKSHLEKFEIALFVNKINSFYAMIPFNLYQKAKEGLYHALFICFLERLGIKTRSEERTNNGQIDLIAELTETTYLFEFKLDGNSQKALEQIKTKKYHEKYFKKQKNLVLIGINFSSESRNISDFSGEAFSSTGSRLELTI